MAGLSTRVKCTFRTFSDLEFSVTFFVSNEVIDPTDTRVQAIVTAINALTRAVCFRIEITRGNPHAVTPTSAAFYVNEDKAEFTFTGEGGLAHTYKIPGLKPTILNSDRETINCFLSVQNAFVTYMSSHAQGAGGETLTAPTVAYRRAARKTLKK